MKFVGLHQNGPGTRGFLVGTCTRQQGMHDDRSAVVTEHLDGWTILMDAC